MSPSYHARTTDVVAIVGRRVYREIRPRWREVFAELHGDPNEDGYDRLAGRTTQEAKATKLAIKRANMTKHERILRELGE